MEPMNDESKGPRVTVIAHESAAEIDSQLAALYTERNQQADAIVHQGHRVHSIAGDSREGRSRSWKMSFADAKAAAKERAMPWDKLDEILASIAAANARVLEILAEQKPLDEIFVEHRWSRFFLVTSSDGHVHSSLGCSTCYPQTTYAWLPGLSGLTMAEAVEAHGEILCSVCFPDAPAAWTEGVSKATLAERSERDAAKAERAAKKLAKALMPDGSTLRIKIPDGKDRHRGWDFDTLYSARIWLTDAASWNRTYPRTYDSGEVVEAHPSYPTEVILQVAEAVAAKTGVPADEILVTHAKKAAKRDGIAYNPKES